MASSSRRWRLRRSLNGLINFVLPRRSSLTRRVNEASDFTVASGLGCVCETRLFLLISSFVFHLLAASSSVISKSHVSALFSLSSTSSSPFSSYFSLFDGACRSRILLLRVLFIGGKKSAIWITDGGSTCRIHTSRLHQKRLQHSERKCFRVREAGFLREAAGFGTIKRHHVMSMVQQCSD